MNGFLDPFRPDGPAVVAHDPSGRQLAEQAHAAGVEPAVEQPRWDAVLSFHVLAGEREAQELVDAIAEKLALHPLVDGYVTGAVTAG